MVPSAFLCAVVDVYLLLIFESLVWHKYIAQ